MASAEGGYSEIPRLEGWLTFPEAGEILDVTKQMVHKMAFGRRRLLLTVRRVGDKPIYVVKEEEVLALKLRREQELQQEE